MIRYLLIGILILTINPSHLRACELFAYSSSHTHKCPLLIRDFFKRGNYHPDGWGVFGYSHGQIYAHKNCIKATEDPLLSHTLLHLLPPSELIIAHIRTGSVGSRHLLNTHPFQRKIKNKIYIFAHNGDIKNFKKKFPLISFTPQGQTDSEHIFCHLLGLIQKENIQEWTQKNFKWLHNTLKGINQEGWLNCLLSDGEHLFVYRDKNNFKTLFYTIKSHFPQQVIVSTKKLNNNKWITLLPNQLLVFKKGHLVFNSNKK